MSFFSKQPNSSINIILTSEKYKNVTCRFLENKYTSKLLVQHNIFIIHLGISIFSESLNFKKKNINDMEKALYINIINKLSCLDHSKR